MTLTAIKSPRHVSGISDLRTVAGQQVIGSVLKNFYCKDTLQDAGHLFDVIDEPIPARCSLNLYSQMTSNPLRFDSTIEVLDIAAPSVDMLFREVDWNTSTVNELDSILMSPKSLDDGNLSTFFCPLTPFTRGLMRTGGTFIDTRNSSLATNDDEGVIKEPWLRFPRPSTSSSSTTFFVCGGTIPSKSAPEFGNLSTGSSDLESYFSAETHLPRKSPASSVCSRSSSISNLSRFSDILTDYEALLSDTDSVETPPHEILTFGDRLHSSVSSPASESTIPASSGVGTSFLEWMEEAQNEPTPYADLNEQTLEASTQSVLATISNDKPQSSLADEDPNLDVAEVVQPGMVNTIEGFPYDMGAVQAPAPKEEKVKATGRLENRLRHPRQMVRRGLVKLRQRIDWRERA
ncbi:hypothetical protein K470DRAFT_257651 [Piedraia hortae CBS 480.64]|uniref:Uncharacterized protein n=1 Tax=Piedraia hortae CBS 480.64 TaxID=1314780 RepID=A0A6A7BZG4_9PEZI|nr:hypothetical protein K470DRAFT_257651 [Piedraia hortae CBS 480.64]